MHTHPRTISPPLTPRSAGFQPADSEAAGLSGMGDSPMRRGAASPVARASSPCDAPQARPFGICNLGFGISLGFGIWNLGFTAARRLLGFAILAFGIFTSTPTPALAAPYIEYLYPAGARQGTTVEVTMGGRALDGARDIWVSGGGVTGQVLEVNEPTEAQKRAADQLDATASQTARIRLTIAPDALDGVRDLRIMAKDGLSNRFRFEIDKLPEINEEEPNNSLEDAQQLPDLPLILNGQIKNADRDFFRFHAKAGQHLLIEAKARAIKPFLADAVPPWFQARFAIYDSTGQKLAFNTGPGHQTSEHGNFRYDPDPVLFFKVPADGDYTLEIWDLLSRGREDFVYRLKIGALPYVTDIYPLGGPAAQGTYNIQVRGINLPGTTANTKITIPKKLTGIVEVYANLPAGKTNPRSFELGTHPEVQEQEPNDRPNQAQPVETPVIINGRINKPGDQDTYTFEANAGQKLVFDVMARRLGSPLDARIRLGPVASFNNNPPIVDDTKDDRFGMLTHHADPTLTHTFRRAGNYTITIDDVQGHGGPEYAYRLHITPSQPDFDLRVMPDNLSVPLGGNVVVQFRAYRLDGYDGPIRVIAEGLPPGFTFGNAEIPKGKNTAVLTLAAPLNAKTGAYTPRFFAEAEIDGKTVRHEARSAEELMQAFSTAHMHVIPVDRGYLIVNPRAPFRVELMLDRPADAGPLELPLGKEVEIPVRIIREPNYPAAVSKQQQTKYNKFNKGKNQSIAQQPINVNITRGRSQGMVVTAAVIQPGETTGVIKIQVTNPRSVGQEEILIIEASQRARGVRNAAIAPALPIKILPSEDGAPVRMINTDKKNKNKATKK